MEKHGKATEPETRKQSSSLMMKLLLFVLCVIVMIQFAVIVKCLASLKAMNSRLEAVENEKNANSKSLITENEHPLRRAKRSIDNETDFKKELAKLAER